MLALGHSRVPSTPPELAVTDPFPAACHCASVKTLEAEILFLVLPLAGAGCGRQLVGWGAGRETDGAGKASSARGGGQAGVQAGSIRAAWEWGWGKGLGETAQPWRQGEGCCSWSCPCREVMGG